MEKIKLILLPFAGGSAYSYKDLERHFPAFLDPLPVDLPGHGKRIPERLLYDIDELSYDVFKSVSGIIRAGNPYCIFGHSMGALMAYLLVREIQRQDLPLPRRLLVSGRPGPESLPTNTQKEKDRLRLPPREFMQEVIAMGGTPADMAQNTALLGFFEPALRADFTVLSTFRYPGPAGFDIPISVFMGEDEGFSVDQALLWQKETRQPITLHSFKGGHFFLFEHSVSLANTISTCIQLT